MLVALRRKQLMKGDAAGLTPREDAMMRWVEKTTLSPAAMSRADADALRTAGLLDREILDLAQVTAYFAYVNRMVLALGVEIEDDSSLGYSPSDTPASQEYDRARSEFDQRDVAEK